MSAKVQITPEILMQRLLYRDGLILVLDKPAGIAVHRGPKGGDHLDAYFEALRFGLPRDPALAHRLDKETSGCLILGRHRKALHHMGRLFKQGKIHKTYLALVDGEPEQLEGEIDLPLKPRDPKRGWWMQPDPLGQPARTKWRCLGRSEGKAVLALEPMTGRTHQLRVHCAALGWPICGDYIYGNKSDPDQPLYLHAWKVEIPLSKSKPPIEVKAPIPDAVQEGFNYCGFVDNPPAPQPEPDHHDRV